MKPWSTVSKAFLNQRILCQLDYWFPKYLKSKSNAAYDGKFQNESPVGYQVKYGWQLFWWSNRL